MAQTPNCGAGGGPDTHFGLRIGSIFIILVGATGGALFPVLVKRSKRINLPGYVFEYGHPFPHLSIPMADPTQVRKILWIGCDRMLNPHLLKRLSSLSASLPPPSYTCWRQLSKP